MNVAEAKARLAELIDAALSGEEIIIARRNAPLVRLVPLDEARPRTVSGLFRGRIQMSDDFDAPIEELADYTR